MITSSQEYQEFLAGIAETAPSVLKMRVPSDEPVYEIDLNTRKITPPPFIGVEGDHSAEYIFFRVDRFFDNLDLAQSVGIITFKNAKNEEYYQLIPYYDPYSEYGKIIFPWVIEAPAALYSGQVSFSVKFFKIDPTSRRLVYELNTLPAKTKVLAGLVDKNTDQESVYTIIDPSSPLIVDDKIMNLINQYREASNFYRIYWIDV